MWTQVCAMPLLRQDGLLYAIAAAYALGTLAVATSADYRAWGEMAGIAYLLAALVCLGLGAFPRLRRPTTAVRRARGAVALSLVIGAVVIPLVAELFWRAEARPGANAQPEVAVIERAGDRVAANRSPYLAVPRDTGISPSTDARSVDATSYFPYLPGMVPFGLLNATGLPRELGDARVSLVAFSFLVFALALFVAGRGASRRLRLLQVFVLLPSGALPMVTGGDDLPVLALLLLGVALAQRRRPGLAGVAFGVAATLKLTAWPPLALMALAARDRNGRPAPWRYLGAAVLVLVPSLVAGVASGPGAFFENVVRFPLGLAHVKSPAASPLLGEVLTTVFPGDRRIVTAVLGCAGLVLVLGYLVRHTPHTPAEVCRATAFVLFAATVLAPATRFGYLIYPVNFVVWGYFFDGLAAEAVEGQSRSSRSMRRRVTELAEDGLTPPSAELIEPLSGVTPSSISH